MFYPIFIVFLLGILYFRNRRKSIPPTSKIDREWHHEVNNW